MNVFMRCAGTPGDVRYIRELERSCFEHSWDNGRIDYELAKSPGRFVVTVDERSPVVVAYMFARAFPESVRIRRIAVHCGYRRQGIATQMVDFVDELAAKSYNRDRVSIALRESNLEAQLFFRSLGFVAVDIIREAYRDTGESSYLMTRRVRVCR